MVTCALCGREYRVINPKHVVRVHGVSMEDYRRMFPNLPTSEDPNYYLRRAQKGAETIRRDNPEWYTVHVGKMLREGHASKMENDPEYAEHFRSLQREKSLKGWDDDHKLTHVQNLRSSCGSCQEYRGYNTKSFGERLMIDHLISYGINFEYESVLIHMDNGHSYVPDFYIRDLNLLIEVKSDRDSAYYTDYDLYKHDQSIKVGYDHLIVFNYEYDELDRRIITGSNATK